MAKDKYIKKLKNEIETLKRENKALKREKNRFKFIFDSIEEAIIIINSDRKIEKMNSTVEKLIGCKKDNSIGKPIRKIFKSINTDKQKKVKNTVDKVLEKGKTVGVSNHTLLISKNGDEYHISYSAAPIKNNAGNIKGVVLVFRDITEKYKMQQQIQKSEKKYKALFEHTGTATVIINSNSIIELVNKRFEKLSGYSKVQIEGKKSWPEFIVEEDLKGMKKFHEKKKLSMNSSDQYECRFVDKDEQIHNMIIVEGRIPNSNKYVASLIDITDKKRVEKKLKENEKKYRRLIESTGDFILIHDDKGIIQFVNRSTVEYSGYNKEELIGKHIRELIPKEELNDLHRRKRERLEEEYEGRYHFECPILMRDNKNIYMDVQTTPIYKEEDYNGELVIARDITQRKKIEKEKKDLREQLYQKQKMESIGTLAGGVAHDFNNLLTVIIGMSDYAKKLNDDPKVENSLKEINEAGEKAAKLTDQLLLFSREKDTEFERVDLNKTILDLQKMLERLISEDIEIHDKFEEDLWAIKGDVGQLEQVITNLVINARDAMQNGGKLYLKTRNLIIDEEKARKVRELQPGKYVLLEVEDTGEGMKEDLQDKIFDPFFTTKNRAEGTGMGLSVVHGIIKNHEAVINVYSEPGEGTVFRIYFPALLKQDQTEMGKIESENVEQYSGNGETLLVVEDEKAVLGYLVSVLSDYNYKFLSATNAEEALEIFEKNKCKIDLLICDIVLPGMNGLNLSNKLKEEKKNLDIILSSGYSDDRISQDEIDKKGYKFVRKPFDMEKLLKTIHDTLS